jgi:hypothetical protein
MQQPQGLSLSRDRFRVLIGGPDLNFHEVFMTDPMPTGRQIIEADGKSPPDDFVVLDWVGTGDLHRARISVSRTVHRIRRAGRKLEMVCRAGARGCELCRRVASVARRTPGGAAATKAPCARATRLAALFVSHDRPERHRSPGTRKSDAGHSGRSCRTDRVAGRRRSGLETATATAERHARDPLMRIWHSNSNASRVPAHR